MPLPQGANTPWPPQHCQAVNQQIATWSAWYSSDIEQLSAIYGGGGSGNDTHGVFASEAGGFKATARRIVDNVRRWFWGQRPAGNQARQRLHVPVAADIAAASSDLLFSEPLSVTAPPAPGQEVGDPAAQALLDAVMDDGMYATLLEGGEVCAALGGVYLRVVWDDSVRDRPWITAVHPDAAVPEWKWGDLAAVTFWRIIKSDGRIVVRHLERHEPGKIIHGVYQGDDDTLGHPVSLADYPETAGLAEQLVNGNEIETGAAKLTAVYVPNMKPNGKWRNHPQTAHFGRSDYAGVEPLMDALDMAQSSWMRDVDLGKARLIVPREYMRKGGPGEGAFMDLDQEIYEGVNAMSNEAGQMEIKEVQFDIRVDQHQRTCDALKVTIVGTAGYSGQTFGLTDGAPAATATEVDARKQRSNITRERKIRYWRPKLTDVLETLLQVWAVKFPGAGVKPLRPQIEWPPAVAPDSKALAEELALLEQAVAISTFEKVRRQHPEWTVKEIDEEVARIQKDKTPLPLEDPGAELGPPNGPPGQPGADPDEE